MFSIVMAKRRRRKANDARKGVAPRPCWSNDEETDAIIREAWRASLK
jgi:hypothetical protein